MHATEYSKAINDAPCGDGCGPVVHCEARCRTLANPACPTLRTSHQRAMYDFVWQRIGSSAHLAFSRWNLRIARPSSSEVQLACCLKVAEKTTVGPMNSNTPGKPPGEKYLRRDIIPSSMDGLTLDDAATFVPSAPSYLRMGVVSFENSRLFDLWDCLGLPTWGYCAFTFVGTLLLLIVMEFSFAAGNDHFQRKFEGLLEPGYRRDIDKAYPAILFCSLQDSGKMIDRRDLLYGKRPVAMGSDWTSDNRSLLAPSRQHRDDAELNTLVTWRNEQVAEFAVMAN
ncbi:predicted protein [Coccidioides posadasii str. Silveira]|uniref:Predicted protein n=1 Tax=Coccidioides posadasii (strain RMSCC 757 / Silveira) TaxID=443226 RepID=E9D8Q4_COCPS|nr:predicted protein [Coccidioides posadasii str. Silveira]